MTSVDDTRWKSAKSNSTQTMWLYKECKSKTTEDVKIIIISSGGALFETHMAFINLHKSHAEIDDQ